MVDDEDGPESAANSDGVSDGAGGVAGNGDAPTDELSVDDAALDGRGGPRAPRDTVGELSDEDLTDLDKVEGIQVESPDTPIQRGTIDRENALFVVLGVLLSVLVFLEFLSVLPGG